MGTGVKRYKGTREQGRKGSKEGRKGTSIKEGSQEGRVSRKVRFGSNQGSYNENSTANNNKDLRSMVKEIRTVGRLPC